jgi:hypothetical protein
VKIKKNGNFIPTNSYILDLMLKSSYPILCAVLTVRDLGIHQIVAKMKKYVSGVVLKIAQKKSAKRSPNV